MKKIIPIFMFVLMAIMLVSTGIKAETNNETSIVLFYSDGCQYCIALEDFLSDLKKEYDFDILKYEVHNISNIKIFEEYAARHNTKINRVPTLFINDKVIDGFNNEKASQIREEIAKKNTNSITGNVINDTNTNNIKKAITIPAVILAAFVDSINPCEFAILILLLTTILAAGNRKKALYAGIAFSLAIFISYFLMGLGLYSAIKASGLSRTLYIVFAFIAILVGLFNLKDYFWYGKLFLMEVPLSWRPKMKMLVKSVTSIPGAFILGIIISLFLLPCTSGPYIVVLGMLADVVTKNYAMMLLVLYNLIFILPMLAITLAIYYGMTTTEKAEQWRTRKLRVLHLIAGIILIALGLIMLFSRII